MKKIIELSRKYKLIILISIVFLLILTNYLIPKKEVKPPTQPSQSQTASYRSLIPGTSSKQDTIKILGKPLNPQDEANDNVPLEFNSTSPNRNHDVFFEENKVNFIKEIVSSNDNKNAKDIINEYGKTNYIFYESVGSYSTPSFYLYVYPSNGIAYIGHPKTGLLLEIWYFKSTNINEFKNTWAKDYVKADPKQL